MPVPLLMGSSTKAIANGIYQEHAFDRRPMLADVLQDAGCDNAGILDHRGSAGEHVLGDWVLTLPTGRE